VETNQTLSHYRLLEKIGEGGMGVVYRAHDTRLERDVAVKVLPTGALTDDTARKRFRNEALSLSKLNHPHIESVHDFGTEDGVDFLVMEYLEGETLAARLAKGALPLDQIVRIGLQVIGALEAAHHQGFVHRDLKPGNIMLTRSGAKLLDFGLARMEQARPDGADLTASPTVTSPLTADGSIVGTFQYMAPEQFDGAVADARSDIFAFGAILYEMATGRKAFEGKSQASLIAAILKEEPRPISSIENALPPALDRLVRACLAKNPEERIQSAHDIRLELAWIGEGEIPTAVRTAPRGRWSGREWVAWALTLIFALIAAVLTVRSFRTADMAPRTVRFTVLPPRELQKQQGTGFPGTVEMAIAPDGQRLVFVNDDGKGRRVLWSRDLDAVDARPLPGTEGARYPFWSPDGHYVGFFADGALKKTSFPDGPVQVVCSAPTGRGGAWNTRGTIIFSADKFGPIYRVPADGGQPIAVTEDQSKQGVTHRWPAFLPDQSHFLYVSEAQMEGQCGLYVGSLESKERTAVFTGVSSEMSNAVFVPPRHLVLSRDRRLTIQPFDVKGLRLTGDPLSIAPEPVSFNRARVFAALSVSANGVLAFQPDEIAPSHLEWLDRAGKQLSAFGPSGYYGSPSLAPDGTRLLLRRHERHSEEADVWLYDLVHDSMTRLTVAPGSQYGAPHWFPDGRRVAFGGARGIFLKEATGATPERLIHESILGTGVTHVSHDGRSLLFTRENVQTQQDLWLLSLEGERKARPLLQARCNESDGRFSPDGRWLAYVSDESGRSEVYVRPFPAVENGRWQVSTAGGSEPRWRRDGRELYFLSGDSMLMAVNVPPGLAFEFSPPQALFTMPAATIANDTTYDVSSDGSRFLTSRTPESGRTSPITVVLNWTSDLGR
jgi:Tol biopolymer transport system component